MSTPDTPTDTWITDTKKTIASLSRHSNLASPKVQALLSEMVERIGAVEAENRELRQTVSQLQTDNRRLDQRTTGLIRFG